MLPSQFPPEAGTIATDFFNYKVRLPDGRVEKFGWDYDRFCRRLDELAGPDAVARLEDLNRQYDAQGRECQGHPDAARPEVEYVEAEEVEETDVRVTARRRPSLPPPPSVPAAIPSFASRSRPVTPDDRFQAHDGTAVDDDMAHRRPGHVHVSGLDGV